MLAWRSFLFSSRRRHTRLQGDWSSDVCSSDLELAQSPNVACKLSGLVTEARWFQWRLEDFRPYLDTVWQAFGEDRRSEERRVGKEGSARRTTHQVSEKRREHATNNMEKHEETN